MVMNHSEAQVFWKVRDNIWLSVRYKNERLEELKEHTSFFLKWLRSHHTTALEPRDENFQPPTFKLGPNTPIPLWNKEAQTNLLSKRPPLRTQAFPLEVDSQRKKK